MRETSPSTRAVETTAVASYVRPTIEIAQQADLKPEVHFTQEEADRIIDRAPFSPMLGAMIEAGRDPATTPRYLDGQLTRYRNLVVPMHGRGLAWAIGRGIELGEMPEQYTYEEPGSNMFLHLAFFPPGRQPVEVTGIDFDKSLVAAGKLAVPALQKAGDIVSPQVNLYHVDEATPQKKVDTVGHILYTQYKPPELVLAEARARGQAIFSIDILHGDMRQTEEEVSTSRIAYKARTLDGREVSTGVGLEMTGTPTEVSKGIFIQAAHLLTNTQVYDDQNMKLETTPYDNHQTMVTYWEKDGERTVIPWAILRKNATDEQYERWLSVLRIIPDIFHGRAIATQGHEVWGGNNQAYFVDHGREQKLQGRARYTVPELGMTILPGLMMYFGPQIGQQAAMGLIRDIGPGRMFEHPGVFFQHMSQYLRKDEAAVQADDEAKLVAPVLGMAALRDVPAAQAV